MNQMRETLDLFENVWNNFLLSPLEFARYIDEFESPWVGAYFDVGNIVNYGWPEHWIRTLGKRIGKLDIKEFSRKRRNDEGLWKGFGVKIGDGPGKPPGGGAPWNLAAGAGAGAAP